MKSTKIISTFFILNLFIFSSCNIDDETNGSNYQQNVIPDTFSQYFGNEISRDFLGTVIDKNHLPIEGVTVTIGEYTALTDSNGVFVIQNANVNERFGYIKADKAGYIHGSRSVVPSNGTNKVTIMLLEATIVGTVNSGGIETVTANDGSSVSFDGNFIKEDGSTYTGAVNVIMHHLDPSDEDMPMQMPGMLYAQNEDGAERMLQTLGMLAVELRGSGGEDLNLAEGSISEIKMPVDPSLMSIAPPTIPLWYFDEANGYWKEEGFATLQGDMYVGTVSHFSFWNCDIPAEAITLCVNTINEDNNPLTNLSVNITSASFGTTNGYTNENGEVCGFVPSGEILEMHIYSQGACSNDVLITQTIGPFNTDSNLTVTVPNIGDVIQETVIGTLNDCDGNEVTDGYAILTHENNTYIELVDDGTFEFSFLRCSYESSSFNLYGIDFESIETSANNSYLFSSSSNTNIGTISTCISQDEYIAYTIDDTIDLFFTDDIHVTFGSDRFTILRLIENNSTAKFLADLPSQIGNYAVESTNTNIFNFTYQENSYYNYIYYNQSGIDIEVTYIGAGIGDYIDINFSGTFIHQGNTRNITGGAHVRIDQQ